MKSIKPQSKPIASKNQLDEKNMPPGIQMFFKPVPKTYVNKEKAKTDDSDKLYCVGMLKEKLRLIRGEATEEQFIDEASQVASGEVALEEQLEGGHCNDILKSASQFECSISPNPNCTECAQKDIAISEWERKYNELKKIHAKQSINLSELYSKYNDLLKTVENFNKPEEAEEASSSTDMFTASEVKFLQCMDLGKTKDCTFVHHCIKFAYKGDLTVLASRTLNGTAAWTGISKNGEPIHREAKAPLTPEKVRRFKSLFADRISKCKIGSAEFAERIKDPYVNKLIAAGVKNLSQKKN